MPLATVRQVATPIAKNDLRPKNGTEVVLKFNYFSNSSSAIWTVLVAAPLRT